MSPRGNCHGKAVAETLLSCQNVNVFDARFSLHGTLGSMTSLITSVVSYPEKTSRRAF
jgi:hypothetical protein